MHTLVADNDGHWYIIPSDLFHDWLDWLEQAHYDDDVPHYAKEVGGGPTRVRFDNYVIP